MELGFIFGCLGGGGLVYTSNVMTKVVMDCMVDIMEDILFSGNKPCHSHRTSVLFL